MSRTPVTSRALAIVAKSPRPRIRQVVITGGPVPMTDAAAGSVEELIAIGQAVDADRRRNLAADCERCASGR